MPGVNPPGFPGSGVRRPITSKPEINQWSVDRLVEEANAAFELGIPTVLHLRSSKPALYHLLTNHSKSPRP